RAGGGTEGARRDLDRRPRGGHGPRGGRPTAQAPGDQRAREEGHRLPRVGARAGGVGHGGPGACPQGDDPRPRSDRRPRPRGAGGRQVAHDPGGYARAHRHGDGGRAAEEYMFGEPTSGASSDIEQATRIARTMVTEYGMSARLGAVRYGGESVDPMLGRGGGGGPEYSPEIARAIDEEVRRIIDAAHTEAWTVLEA